MEASGCINSQLGRISSIGGARVPQNVILLMDSGAYELCAARVPNFSLPVPMERRSLGNAAGARHNSPTAIN